MKWVLARPSEWSEDWWAWLLVGMVLGFVVARAV